MTNDKAKKELEQIESRLYKILKEIQGLHESLRNLINYGKLDITQNRPWPDDSEECKHNFGHYYGDEFEVCRNCGAVGGPAGRER